MGRAKLTTAAAIVACTFVGMFAACSDDEADTAGSGNNGQGAQGNQAGTAGSGGSNIGGFHFGGSFVGGSVPWGGNGGSDVCAESTITPDIIPANMYFLIDRTGSMRCNPPPTQSSDNCKINPQKLVPSEDSKWEITRDALGLAFTGLEDTAVLPSIGIAYFNNDDYCGFPDVPDVDIVALSGNPATDPQLAALLSSLAAVTPEGHTPIIGTVMRAYNYLYTRSSSFTGNKFVVLLTDGAETCDPPSRSFLVSKAEEAHWVGIRTFVLGAPGSEDERAFLSQLAWNGGTASDPDCDHSGSPPDVGDCHIDMTVLTDPDDFAEQLAAALDRISREALSCIFDVPVPGPGEPPVDLGKINVKYRSGGGPWETIPQDTTVACDDPSNQGWQYIDGGARIELCSQWCERVKNDPYAEITIELGCQTEVVPE